tara:strand:- start:1479 stop:2495 length:1017 start_codon:yes stop_codon:yes gene_type:complete
MSEQKKNTAVLGCGHWGKNLVRNFNKLGALGLVCDVGEPGRAKSKELAPDVEVSAEFEEAFTRDDIEGVVLATPAETHLELAMRAMESGKDVYVEKPMALDFREGVRMKEFADRHKRILMVGHILEYHPAVKRLRALLADGTLGKVNYIYSNRLNFGKIRTEENALWSFAPHDIAVILRLVGEMPLEVTATGGSYITPNLADVTISTMHFRSGVRAHIFVSWLNPFKEQKLVVMGDKKMAVFDDVSKDAKLSLHQKRVDFDNRVPQLSTGENEVLELAEEEPLRNECQHFLDCIESREEPLTSAESGIQVLRVLQACQTSLELHGRPVVLQDLEAYMS